MAVTQTRSSQARTSHGRVLVTGGAGFIGINLAPVPAEPGPATRCCDDFRTGHRADAERAAYDEIVEGDSLDASALAEAARDCSHVVQLAAQAGVPASVADPVADRELNVRGTLHALLAALDAGVQGFVLPSSSARLGEITPLAHEGMAGDVTRGFSDSSLASERFGFEPKVALAEGLDGTVAWFREWGG